MITAITLGGTSLISNKIGITDFNNGSFPSTVYTKSKRGGFQGTKLITPSFSSYQFVADFIITGGSFTDLVQQRDSFFGILGNIHSQGTQRLLLTRSDGAMRFYDCKAIAVTGDISAQDGLQSKVQVTLEGEYPFLQSIIPTFKSISINSGGGMTVPMGVPLNLTHGASTSVSITSNGNYPAYPMLTFYGQLTTPNLTITQNGIAQSINFSNTLSSSSFSMVTDCYNRTVVLEASGNPGRQYMSGTFFQIPVGTSTVSLTTTNGGDSGYCSLSFNDSFLNI